MSGSESAGDVSCGGPKADMRGVTTGRPLLTGLCCKTLWVSIAGLGFKFWAVGWSRSPLWRLLTPSTLDVTPTQDRPPVKVAAHGREFWQAASGSARLLLAALRR